MTRKKTDFRALKARRDAALQRPELRHRKPPAPDRAMIDAAIAAGRVTKIPSRRRRQ